MGTGKLTDGAVTSNRPLSPHLQIYKPQLTSVLSILHRGTGLVITAGSLVIAAWLWSMVLGESCYAAMQSFLTSIPGTILMVAWTWCMSYHMLNGVRHLVWDAGFGYEIPDAYRTGKAVVAGSFLVTLGVWLI